MVIAGFQIIVIAGAHASCAALLFPDVKGTPLRQFRKSSGESRLNSRVRKPHVAVLNLGMRFSNKCSVRLTIRRMDRFISMIMVLAGCIAQRNEWLSGTAYEKGVLTISMPASLTAIGRQLRAAYLPTWQSRRRCLERWRLMPVTLHSLLDTRLRCAGRPA